MKKNSYIILAISAVLLSRLTFVFFDDTEGPNLLVVTMLALVLYSLSYLVNSFYFSTKVKEENRLLYSIFTQIFSAVVLFLILK
jgi:uncharacterized membrane protein (GlpM family)